MSKINLTHLQIKNPKSDETGSEATQQIFSSLFSRPYSSLLKTFIQGATYYSFEMYLLSQTIYLYITSPKKHELFIKSLLQSSYPSAAIQKTTDPMEIVYKSKYLGFADIHLSKSSFLPIKTYDEFKDVDPLAPLIGLLSKQDSSIKVCVQFLLTNATFNWQNEASNKTKPDKDGAIELPATSVSKKVGSPGGKVCIRVIVGSEQKELIDDLLFTIGSTFGVFTSSDGNALSIKKVKNSILTPWKDTVNQFKNHVLHRISSYFEHEKQILNSKELATLWHPAGQGLSQIKNVSWGKTLAGEAPLNLPIVESVTAEDRGTINFFAKTQFKNKETIFGLRQVDRRRHCYIIGKTGAGKSTLIANMAIDDIRNGRGVGVIDPHGDLCEDILEYIPKRRMKDVVYLEPFDVIQPFALNVLEIKNKELKDLISSGIISIFKKLYVESWGPRLEYILRNSVLTLLEVPGATLPDILPLLGDPKYRKSIMPLVKDPIIRSFWENEFDKMNDKLKTDAISPIQNKIGQFVTSKMIRNIIGVPKSTVDLREIMDSKKILLLNLSQGKLGEDNAALLGAMIITQIQLAAMGRAFVDETEREDFFLYVDEFQNFATSSFIKILSEARKYRLSLILANQYIDQIDESIQHAIFGNVGTVISFIVGAKDAEMLSKQFQGVYSESDLVGLGKHEIVLKLCIDNMTSNPFPARTLPPPSVKNGNVEEIVKLSKKIYGRTIKKDEEIYENKQTIAPTETAHILKEEDTSSIIEKLYGKVEKKEIPKKLTTEKVSVVNFTQLAVPKENISIKNKNTHIPLEKDVKPAQIKKNSDNKYQNKNNKKAEKPFANAFKKALENKNNM